MNSHPLFKKALFFEYLTIAWNVFEGLSCIVVGIISGSIALFAYGLESSVEIFASAVVVWQLQEKGKKKEKLALELIGIAYLIVSAFIFIDASKNLIEQHHPDRSFTGIVLMIVTVCAMGSLGISKQRVGKKMESQTVLADAKFTLIDTYLAATVLIGLALNTLFGFWWADYAMALFLSGVAFREGLKELL